MARYRFMSTWLLDAAREPAWDAIQDAQSWPEWWRGVDGVEELDPGDENKVGSRYTIAWRSRIPYPLEFEFLVDRVERPFEMSGRAFGELEGDGHWRLFEDGGLTAVTYEWNVQTTKRWMKAIGPIARPAFAWNHDVVMGWGGEGLAKRLGAQLVARH